MFDHTQPGQQTWPTSTSLARRNKKQVLPQNKLSTKYKWINFKNQQTKKNGFQ